MLWGGGDYCTRSSTYTHVLKPVAKKSGFTEMMNLKFHLLTYKDLVPVLHKLQWDLYFCSY